MFLDFFTKLKDSKIPVSLNEFLIFLDALKIDYVQFDVDKFYYLARTCLVKDERLHHLGLEPVFSCIVSC